MYALTGVKFIFKTNILYGSTYQCQTINQTIMKKILLILMAFVFAFGVKAQQLDVNAAKQLVIKNSIAIGMSADDLNNFRVSNAYSNEGMQMVYLLQDYKGLPVFNQMRVLAFKNGDLNSNAGGFIADISKSAGNASATPALNAETAVGSALRELKVTAPSFLKTPVTTENGRKNNFGIISGVSENLTAELLWVPVESGKQTVIKLAWQVMVASEKADWWLVQVDANTGSIINKISLTSKDNWDLPNGAGMLKAVSPTKKTDYSFSGLFLPSLQTEQSSGNSPSLVTNASYLVVPFPNGAPGSNGTVVTNPWTAAPGNATTLGWHNDVATDYTITRGNNVWATADINGTGSNNPPSVPATSTTSPDPLTFNFPPDYTVSPTSASFQPFAITNLFYWNNIMHDVSYQYGFNEVSANFQTNNLSRGGLQNDNVRALAQSGAGTNNADFSAASDGTRGQMRMFQFTGVPTLHVNAPASLVGNYACTESAFSTNNLLVNVGPVTAPVFVLDDAVGNAHQGCGALASSLTGKIALIYRGNCNFTVKVLAAQNAGAVGVIMVNNVPGATIIMGGTDNTITIPAVMVSDVDGAILLDQANSTLNVTLSAGINKDGDVVPDIMCHEYGHGISGRLTGGGVGSCLNNAEQGGEGWSDYMALMVTTKWSTATTADGPTPRYIGNYVAANLGYPATGGIRNYPYSTNIATNPLTYSAVGLGAVAPWLYGAGTEVHNIGEVWCEAVWEMTWGIIQQENSINPNIYDYTSAGTGGNSISLKLVIEGMKLQPCSPGYIDARNAILKADRNLYCGRHACAIWTAFAKRGMGQGSSQGSSNSLTDQTSTTTMPAAPAITTSPVSQTIAAGGNVTFTANAGTDVNLIYQWQVSTDNGANWTDISCQITSTLTLNAVTTTLNGYQYRAKVYIACLSTNTAAATLTVTGASNPAITLTSAANTNAQTVCINTAITNIVYSTSNGVTGATVTSLPTGVTGAYSGGTNGTFTISGTPTAAGTFNYTVTTSGGSAAATATGTITVTALPAAPTVTSPVIYCQGATAVPLTATGTNLHWYTVATGGTGSTTAPTPSTAAVGNTIYYVSQTPGTCEGPRASITVTVNAAPAAPTVVSPVTYCQGATAVPLTATGTNLLWYTAATGGTGSATAPTPSTASIGSTTYYVSQTTGTCESPRAAIVVNITATTPAPTVTSPVTYCQGATAVPLTATGTGLLWYAAATGGVGSATAPTPSTAAAGSTNYYVSQTTSCGEGPRASITVTVNALPAAPTVSSPVAYCQGATAVPLTATGTNLLWYTTATGGTGSATAPTPSTASAGSTTYYVSQSAGSCEGPRAAIVVNVTASPAAPTVVSPVSYCQNAAAVPLTATGTNLLWYTAATGGTGSATAPTPSTATVGSTTYYVSQTTGTCESPRAAIVVNVTAGTPAPTVTSPVTYCQNGTAVPLTATGTNLLWYTAATGGVGSATAPTPSTTTIGSTTYYVSQTLSCGEGPRAAIVVNVTAPPAAPTVVSPVTYCQGATAVPLTATGSNLLWYTAATGGVGSATAPTPSTTAAGSTIYYVSQTVGCESPRAAITVTVNATPAAPTVVSPVTYCQGATAVPLTATGTNLLWYTAATGGTGSAIAPTPSTATAGSTIYYVSQTAGTCEGPRASITVTVNPTPAAPTVSSPVTYCQGATAVPLTATGTNLLWYTAATGGVGSATAPTPSTATAGSTTYYVSQTTGTCEGPRAAISVVVNALPAAPTVSTPVTYCQGSTAVPLTATGTNLLWYTTATGGTGSSTAPTPSTATAGSTTYYVSQTATSCEGPRAAIVVTVNPTPGAPTVTSPVNYCFGSATVPLTATGTNLKWYTVATGGTGSTTAPTPSSATVGSTTYYVSQTTGTCEGPRAAIVVNITAGAAITQQPVDITSCATTATFTVTATGTNLSYQWQVSTDGGNTYNNIPGATSATLVLINLTPAQSINKYRVVVTAAGCGAVTSNAVSAHVGTPPVVVLTAAPSTVYNPSHNGGLFTTVSPAGNYTYQWTRDGSVLATGAPYITAANGLLYDFGTYVVSVTDMATGCTGVSNSVTIVDDPGDRGHLFISPNPTSGIVHVSFYSSTTASQSRGISVYDGKGARIMNNNFTITGRYADMIIDLTGKPAGTYMIVLQDASGKKIASGEVVKF